ncbi:MAG: DUF503 family protein [Bacillota bacterium]|nr:DUF503 family protein [Bacillota bacterium]
MVVLKARILFLLPAYPSSRERRRLTGRLVKAIPRYFNVSCAELDEERASPAVALGLACVSTTPRGARWRVQQVVSWLEEEAGAEVLEVQEDYC